MKNIHVLPTDKPSRLHFTEEELVFTPKYKKLDGVNICITSDEEIKEGDWMIRGNEQPIKVIKDFFWDFGVRYYKIILTTDQDLIKDGVQAIPDEFLEWFVKNPSCEEVEVKKEQYHTFVGMKKYPMIPTYKIIIPQEEPKQETTLEDAAEKLYPEEWDWREREIFINGAKWQQERSYSKEDMRDYAIFYYTHQGKATKYWGKDLFKEWFEQFSKLKNG